MNMKKALGIILVNIIVVVVLLVLVEGGVRVFSSNVVTQSTDESILLEHRYGSTPGLKPLAVGEVFGKQVKVDAYGFLLNSCASKKKRKKILFFGDSVTMGVGVESDSSFAARLQHYFCDSLEIDNLSLIGYNINDYVRITEKLHAEKTLQLYDEVVVFFCLNDNFLSSAVHSSLNDASVFSSAMEWLKGKSYTYVALKGLATDRSEAHYLFDKELYKNDTLLQNLNTKIASLKSLVAPAKLSFVLLPYEYQLRENYANDCLPQQKLISILNKEQISFLDAGKFLAKEGESEKDLYLYADGIHFSNEGHRALFNIILSTKAISSLTHTSPL